MIIKHLFKLLRKGISILLLGLIIFAAVQYSRDAWTKEQVQDYIIQVLKIAAPIIALLYVFYKTKLERIILWFDRKSSGKAMVEDLPHVVQKSGKKRAGKDASSNGAGKLINEYLTKHDIKKMRELQYILYLYDFKSIDNWLDTKNGMQFLVAGKERIDKIYKDMLLSNDCFIKPYYLAKGVSPYQHYHLWKKYAGDRVLEYNFDDGIVPGGIPFLDLLLDYITIYVNHHFVPQFIMSNQPMIESFTINGKKIEKVFAKKLNQDIFKLKEDHAIPLPFKGMMIETEIAIVYSNTNKENEEKDKNQNGVREFHTIFGHIGQERLFFHGITQDPKRTMKSLRELFPGYQHVFKMKFRSTSNYKRLFISIRIILKKFKIYRIRFFRWIKFIILKLIGYVFKNLLDKKILHILTAEYKSKCLANGFSAKRILRITKKISKLESKKKRSFNNGYLQFYIGVYDNIEDVGKKVQFPKFGVLKESSSNNLNYTSYGFIQTNRISDCFGTYNTHFMNIVRTEKEKIHSDHFNDLDEWTSLVPVYEDIKSLNYEVFNELIKVSTDRINKANKELKKLKNKIIQKRAAIELPNFIVIDDSELIFIAKEYGIDLTDINMKSTSWRADVIQKLSAEWRNFSKKEL